MIYGYDLDGTLCTKIPSSPKPWGKMKGFERISWKQNLLQEYQKAQTLLEVPLERKFHVISARKNTMDVLLITHNWLQLNFPKRFLSVRLLDESRSIENVVKFKSSVILEQNITWFAEDNWQVVKGLRAELKDRCKVLHYKNGLLIE